MNSANNVNDRKAKSLLDVALDLASKGYPVFPLKPNSKDPVFSGGFHNATTDPDQIRKWWKRNPNYNIGIAAPELLVIDLDTEGFDAFVADNKAKLFGDFVPAELPAVRTAGGGFHYYMRVQTSWADEWGIGNNNDFLPGVDLKGCGRGYVVGPGSVVDGRHYEMAGGGTELPAMDQLPMIPDQTKAAIEQARSKSKKPAEPKRNGHEPVSQSQHETSPADPELLHRFAETLPTLWKEGRRQELALGISGMLRKLGYDEADVANLIASVAAGQGDTELVKRVLAVRDTYAKPIEQIAGLSLLTDDEKQAIEPILRHGKAWSHGETVSFEQGRILRAISNRLGWTDARYNEVRFEIEILDNGNWRKLEDGDVAALAFIELPFKAGEATVWRPVGKERAYDAIYAYANQNKYDPIADLLENQLPEWDGQDHIGELAGCIKHSIPPLPGGADPVEVSLRKWLVGAVARALNGDQNFVPVLVGRQDIGKSSLARWLAMFDWLFSDSAIDPDTRETAMTDSKVLIHEIAELGSVTRRKDVDALKRYLTASTSDVRLPYARTLTTIRHRASYIATSNEAADLLRDTTGNRRFLALRIDEIDWSYRDRIDPQQIWAQAVALYRCGFDFRLSEEEKEFQRHTNAQHESLRVGTVGEFVLDILEHAVELCEERGLGVEDLYLLPPSLLAQEYLRMTGNEDGTLASVARIGTAKPGSGEIAIWASMVALLAARVLRGDQHRFLQEINAMVARVGGQTSHREYIDDERRRCVLLTLDQARALIDYLS